MNEGESELRRKDSEAGRYPALIRDSAELRGLPPGPQLASILIMPLMRRRLRSIKAPLAKVLILYLPCSTVGHRKLAQAVIINSGIWGASLLQGVSAQ